MHDPDQSAAAHHPFLGLTAWARTRMILGIPLDLLNRIHGLGEAAYPEETAGFLLGSAGSHCSVQAILPAVNASAGEARRSHYLIGPEDYAQAEEESERRGIDVVGVFHSHPDQLDEPSDFDREWAQPNFSYLITSIRAGRAAASRSWRLSEDRSRFEQEPIRAL